MTQFVGSHDAQERKDNRRPTIILAVWAEAAQHSTVVNTAQVLSERGFDVHIVYRAPAADETFMAGIDFGADVYLHPVGQGASQIVDALGVTARATKGGYLQFLVAVRRAVHALQPRLVIGYDIHGVLAATVGTAGRSTQVIYHNFDLYVPGGNLLSRVLPVLEHAAARRALVTVFSTPDRGAIFRGWASLPYQPLPIFNAQRLTPNHVGDGSFRSLLVKRDLRWEKIVLHLGTLCPDHGLEATVRSIPSWKSDWGLALVGMTSPTYHRHLMEVAREVGVENRLLIVPEAQPHVWIDALLSADLGIALYEPVNLNQRYMAGAANKVNLYLSAGIPVVGWDSDDMRRMAERHGFGPVANPTDPQSIAEAIHRVLDDDERYAAYCEAAYHAFRTEFNFEHQFAPLLQRIGEVRDSESYESGAGVVVEKQITDRGSARTPTHPAHRGRDGNGQPIKGSILCLCPEMATHGGIQHYSRLACAVLIEEAERAGWTCEVVSLNDGPGQFSFNVGARTYSASGYGRNKTRLSRDLLRLARSTDIVYVTHVNLSPLALAMDALNPKLRYWVTGHGMEVWEPLSRLHRSALQSAKSVVAVSRHTASVLTEVQGIPANRVSILPNALEPGYAETVPSTVSTIPVPEGSRLLLSVARLAGSEPGKGIDTTIAALPKVLERIPDAFYLVIGDGDDRTRLQQLALETGVDDRSCFPGFVDTLTLRACYGAAELFVLPSKQEGFGIVFLEAMAMGTPVVASPVGGVGDLVRSGTNGVFVPPDLPETLAEALIDLLIDDGRRERMGQVAEKAAVEFGFERFRRSLCTIVGLEES